MNPPHKSGNHQISTRALRLELLIRAHEVAQRINERVKQVLASSKPAATQPTLVSETEHSEAN